MKKVTCDKKENFDNNMDTPFISRRKWMRNTSMPALAATFGGGFLSTTGPASSATGERDKNTLGARTYNIRDFGALGNGKTLDTDAVQKAIDTCNKEKGGIVLVPEGKFVVGTLELKSNVTLHLSVQGVLLGSPDRKEYEKGKGIPPGNGNLVLLYAVNAQNISIEGRGTLDGNGRAFFTGKGDNTGPGAQRPGYFDRPHLVIFYNCTNILLRDTFFTASAYHCFRILNSKQINIDGVRIYNRVNKNNDGFHFNSCQYAHIINCDIACQDDACALFGSNEFVTVTNCTFSTRWSVFRFGSGETRHVAISNCLIHDTYGCPVKISSGSAKIENFTFSNIVMKNVTGPIGIGFTGGKDVSQSFVRNIVFNGIRATVVPIPVNHDDIPFEVSIKEGEENSCITFNGVGEAYLENISLTDVHVTYAGGGSADQASKRNIPEVAREYFGVWNTAPFGPPAYGLYARNVKGLTLNNVRFEYLSDDLRPAIVFDNVRDASITALSVQGNTNGEAVLRISNSKDILFTATRLLGPSSVFVQVEGPYSEGILIDGGDLRKAKELMILKDGASKDAVQVRI